MVRPPETLHVDTCAPGTPADAGVDHASAPGPATVVRFLVPVRHAAGHPAMSAPTSAVCDRPGRVESALVMTSASIGDVADHACQPD